MKKILFLLTSLLFLSGCIAIREAQPPDEPKKFIEIEEAPKVVEKLPEPKKAPPPLKNVSEKVLDDYAQKNGVIFAKTDFQGVLKTEYVKLLFKGPDNSQQEFELHIGNQSNEQDFSWKGKTVEPGYFFIELPVGTYQIASISIPVGTTMATEPMNIRVNVLPNAITYVGTLRVNGLKEKIKLGGLPVIQPGFEYTVEVTDEREEGERVFHERYPNAVNEVVVQLMQAVLKDNKS